MSSLRLSVRPSALLRRATTALVGAALAVSAIGCGPPPAIPKDMRSLEERRAQGIISDAIRRAGEKPAQGRKLKLSDGTEMFEEFAIAGTRFGIAFITMDEAEKHGALPKHDPKRLRLLPTEGKSRVTLLLYHQTYRYDASENHTVTVVTAEKKLSKDVSDFVTQVVKQQKGR